MKNIIKGLTILGMLSLVSCTKTIYTHEQVLDKFQTKEQIAKQFGLPTEKMTTETTEEWLYNYTGNNSNSPYDHSNRTVTAFNNYKKYVLFRMDLQGNVLIWKCEHIDFAVRQKAPGLTIALIVGSAAVLTALVIISGNAVADDIGNSLSGLTF